LSAAGSGQTTERVCPRQPERHKTLTCASSLTCGFEVIIRGISGPIITPTA